MAPTKTPKIPSSKRNSSAAPPLPPIALKNGLAKPERKSANGSNGKRFGRATHNGVANGHQPSFRQLLRKSKELGFVDGADLLKVLPDHLLAVPERLEEVLELFRRHSVAVRSWQAPVMMRKPETRRRPSGPEEVEGFRSNDPVRVYLREMGAVSLLTREGEVEIAKRIEAGENAALAEILKSPIAAEKLLAFGDEIRRGKREVKDMFPPIADGEVETLDDKKGKLLQAFTALRRSQSDVSRRVRVLSNARTSRDTRARLEAEVDEIRLRNAQRIRETGMLKESIYSLADEIKLYVEAIEEQERVIAGILAPFGLRRADEFLSLAEQSRRRSMPGKKALMQLRGDPEAVLVAEKDVLAVQRRIQTMEHESRCTLEEARQSLVQFQRRQGARRPREERADRSEPAPGRVDRQEVHEPRAAVPGPDPGRQHRPDEGGRQVRVPARLQVLDLRDVVDPPGHHARHRGPGAHDPHPRAHDRDDEQAGARAALPGSEARPRARRPKRSRKKWRCRSRRCRWCSRSRRSPSPSRRRSARTRTATSATSSRTRSARRSPTR